MQSLQIVAILLVAFAAYAAAGPGSILVRNSGGYVAVFNADYDMNGQRHSKSSGKFSLGVNRDIQIPDGATNVYLKVEEYWFPGQKTTIFTRSYPYPVTKCFKIWGTTLNPKWAEENC